MSSQRHQGVIQALSQNGPLAPPALRWRIEAELSRDRERRESRSPLLRRLAPAGAIAVAMAALALVLSTLFGGGENPSVYDVHGLNAAGPEAPAPPTAPGAKHELAAQVEGVSFPKLDLRPGFDWRAVGQRTDQVDGRATRTVFYEHEGHVVGYTIVSGKPLGIPANAEPRSRNGVDVGLLRDQHGHDIAVFERGGKTCVISGHVEHRSSLVRLATWSGHGEISF
jgi:hypothetical protein